MREKFKINSNSKGSLHFLYDTAIGRFLLKIITLRGISKFVGAFLSSGLSTFMIKSFINKNNIDMSEFEDTKYCSYNDFFTRRIKRGARKVDISPTSFISPCDSKLTAYKITGDANFSIKGSIYSVSELLQNDELAQKYIDGTMLIFRLSVTDYHRYCYIDNGNKDDNTYIKGVLHTVQPIAFKRYNVYKTNCREYTTLHTQNFGDIIQVEVGAMMVGKIKNLHNSYSFLKGEEKGYFEFGGSTICLILPKDTVKIDNDIFENTQNGYETKVRLGERIGSIYEEK